MKELLQDLAYNIYVKEHKLKYQNEQFQRYKASLCCFSGPSYYYKHRHRSLDDFISDYNKFLNHQIKRSHNNLAPKIEASYRRDYHEGEVSPVTSLIFYLYFKTDKVKRFASQILLAAYRNPYSKKQRKLV
jgi:hypothetical protein